MPRLDVYGQKWAGLRDRAAALVDAGEHDLSRVLRLVEADWRSADASPMQAPVFGTVVTLPRAALVAGRRDLIARVVAAQARPETAFVAELGAGWGQNLLDLWLVGGPRVPYFALEPTPEGRACAEYLAGLDSGLDLTAQGRRPRAAGLRPADRGRARGRLHRPLGRADPRASARGDHRAVRPRPQRDRRALRADRLAGRGPGRSSRQRGSTRRGRTTTGTSGRCSAGSRRRATSEIETVVPDLIGIKPHNASTLVVWHR